MFRKPFLWLFLLSATPAIAASQNFLLGPAYTEQIGTGDLGTITSLSLATDAQGAIYILANCYITSEPSILTKLSPDGSQIVYQTTIPYTAAGMAVSPAGSVFIIGSNTVERLDNDGATVLYQATVGGSSVVLHGIAVDATGRAYVIGQTTPGEIQTTPGVLQAMPLSGGQNQIAGFVMRLKPTGAVDYATYFGQSWPSAIAVDAAGSAFLLGEPSATGFPVTSSGYSGAGSYIARLSVNASSLLYGAFTAGQACCLAVDSADNAVVAYTTSAGSAVIRYNAAGEPVWVSKNMPSAFVGGVALDTSSNAYVILGFGSTNYALQNSVATCSAGGSPVLNVLDSRGHLLQSTYVPGLTGAYSSVLNPNWPGIAIGANSAVQVLSSPDPAYAPTQQLPGSSSGLLSLTSLSPNANAQVVQLACVGNAATYSNVFSGGIAGGEIVSLFGEGLGPAAGTQPEVAVATGFPKQLANVQVTFNGTPAPLLYVQANQINAIAPWSLQTGKTVDVCALYNGVSTNCITRTVVDANPGVFLLDNGSTLAVNQDGSINSPSNPAGANSTVTIYATGLGAISPAQPDGAIIGFPLPVDVLQATMSDSGFGIFGQFTQPITVTYAGPAPLEVGGLSQINFIAVDTGNALTLQVGQDASTTFYVYMQ